MNVHANVTDLVPEIRSRAAEIENARRLPADLARTLAGTGAFRTLIPKTVGGLELDPMAALEVIETIAEADASTGWCAMIAATTGVTAAYLPQDVAQSIYGNPDTITGGVFAPKGQAVAEGDHYRVTGRWNWASGSANCDWLTGGCVVKEDGKLKTLPNGLPDARMMIFPASDVDLRDTWHVVGQAGTGSGDMIVKELEVPKAHSVSLVTDKPHTDSPLYLFPVFGLLALGISAVALGNARGSINDLIELSREKTPQGSTRILAERPQTQDMLARAEAQLSAARAFVFKAVEEAWEKAGRDGAIDVRTRSRVRLAATHAVRSSADVARTMHDLGGGSSVFLSSPLQRRFRDAHVATAHIMTAPATFELTGRVLLDLETDTTFL